MSIQPSQSETVFDPWKDIRDFTARRNALHGIADRYAGIAKQCRAQYQTLKQYPKTSNETLETLKEMERWASAKGAPVWDEVQRIDDIITVRMEHLNNE